MAISRYLRQEEKVGKAKIDNTEVLYISTYGDDSFSGRFPEKQKNDGPFLTLQRAVNEVVNIKKRSKGTFKKQIIVMMRGGTYFIDKPVEIRPEHSGTDKFPVIIMPYKNEKVRISGGKKIKNYREEKINGKRLLVFETDGRPFRNLWSDDRRIYRARYPEKGYLKVAGVCEEDEKKEWKEGVFKIQFNKGDIKRWYDLKNGEVILMDRWVESRLPVISIDEEKAVVEFEKRSVYRPIKDDPYYVENIFEFIDRDRWYIDFEKGMVYFCPAENKKEIELIAPKIKNVLKITGRPEEGKYVENIYFYNIGFSHTEWYFSEEDVGGFAQAAVEVPGAIFCEGMRNCIFKDCEISHIGNYGIELGEGCKSNKIVRCKIYDTGAGGIKIGERIIRDTENLYTCGNEINGCIIKDGGNIFHSAVGIWLGQSNNNLILNNEISDFYYTGISIGWTWGYDKSLAGGNIVRFNYVHHIGKKSSGDGPILSDMGGIYTLGIQEGTLISNNIFHDIYGYWYGGWGIYFDEGSTHIIAENNLVYNTTHGGFHQHYGKENIVRNNIFAFGREQQIGVSRPELHKRITFERNIVVGDTERWIEGVLDFNFVFDKNLYWRVNKGEIRFVERASGRHLTWDEWREKGMDTHSIIANPLFYNMKRCDFRLKKNSPAFKLGFKKFSLPKKIK